MALQKASDFPHIKYGVRVIIPKGALFWTNGKQNQALKSYPVSVHAVDPGGVSVVGRLKKDQKGNVSFALYGPMTKFKHIFSLFNLDPLDDKEALEMLKTLSIQNIRKPSESRSNVGEVLTSEEWLSAPPGNYETVIQYRKPSVIWEGRKGVVNQIDIDLVELESSYNQRRALVCL